MGKNNHKQRKEVAPAMDWQTHVYARIQTIRFTLPMGVLLLCKLMDITPEELIKDFLDNLAHGSWRREGRDEVKAKLREYFLAHGYGHHYYNTQQIEQIFSEMDALGLLYPRVSVAGHEGISDAYVQWREAHQQYFFDKWFHLHGRK